MNRIHTYICALLTTMLIGGFLEANAQQYDCHPAPPNASYKKLIIDAHTMAIKEGTTQYDNNTSLWIVVENINPFVSTYTLKVKRTGITETAIATFLGDIGGVVGDFLPKKSPTTEPSTPNQPTPVEIQPGQPAPSACPFTIQQRVFDQFERFANHRDDVADALKEITSIYQGTSGTIAKKVENVQTESLCNDIQVEAIKLRDTLTEIKSPDEIGIGKVNLEGIPNEQEPTQVLHDEITKLIQEAKGVQSSMLDYRRQLATHSECDNPSDKDSKQLHDEEDFLDKFLGPTTGTPESQAFLGQLNTLKNKYAQFTQAQSILDKLFRHSSSDNPFVLTKAIFNEKQADDEITLEAGTPVTVTGVQTNKATVNPAPPVGAPTKTTTTTTAAFDETIHFGYGPWFSISGGMVTSLLENKQFTTANGQIAYQNNSRSRILPIALLNGRIHDCNAYTRGTKCLLVPQVSFGITAKADDKGTSPEYLVGPSWAFIDRHLFITLGAYAGQQQRLLGGLAIGQTTSLSAANVPVAKEYHWGGAIAITWKLK
jgi:hypothetical protein